MVNKEQYIYKDGRYVKISSFGGGGANVQLVEELPEQGTENTIYLIKSGSQPAPIPPSGESDNIQNVITAFRTISLTGNDDSNLSQVVFTNNTNETLYIVSNRALNYDETDPGSEFGNLSTKVKFQSNRYRPSRYNFKSQPKHWAQAIAIVPGQDVKLYELLMFLRFSLIGSKYGLSQNSPCLSHTDYIIQKYIDAGEGSYDDYEFSARQCKSRNIVDRTGFCLDISQADNVNLRDFGFRQLSKAIRIYIASKKDHYLDNGDFNGSCADKVYLAIEVNLDTIDYNINSTQVKLLCINFLDVFTDSHNRSTNPFKIRHQ